MAAQDLERLVVQLSADIKKYENAMNRAQGITNRQLGSIQKKANTVGNGIGASFARAGAQIAAAFAAQASLAAAQELVDAATRISNALKVAGLAGSELEKVYQALFASAQKNAAPIESLVTLYSRLALTQKELGVTSEELVGFADKVALALRVGGIDAQAASGALLQLSQALGGGTVRAEEFNSVLEGAPTIAQAVAAGLKEAGGSVAKLRQLVVDGKISSEAFFRAFEAGSVMLDGKAASSVLTVGQQYERLRNTLINVAGRINEATGASDKAGAALGRLGGAVEVLGDIIVRIANGPIGTLLGKLDELDEKARSVLGFLANFSLNDEIFNALIAPEVNTAPAEEDIGSLEKELKTLQERIALNTELGFDNTGAIARINEVTDAINRMRAAGGDGGLTPGAIQDYAARNDIGQAAPKTGRLPAAVTVNPVSTSDFAPPVSRGGGSGGRTGGKSKVSDFQREIEQIREKTAALQAETAAQAGLNPLVDDYGYAMERARTEQELLAAAEKAGLAITPQLKANIAQLAEGYAQASVEAQRLQESQEAVRQAAEDFRSTGKDVASGFINDLRQGKSAAEALANALNKVVDKLIDVALNAAFGLGGGGGLGGGFLGRLFSIFGFADGGYTGSASVDFKERIAA
ncbi:tape measure protein [Rhizobium sp. S95]|uniref:Tape measure protein n=1 Tax=Ciceribacter sichuanensis TaxID=2949647 RepID=A0AAJ1C2Q2_9HYPH|nr:MULTISPECIES: tape measure protein [unclassified Ciceribacter]MCM2399430.1 tape measure protein [Ciceribacter sp. S95]MCO5959778.1 tape measure protein [Ciceribacter sp. S101]